MDKASEQVQAFKGLSSLVQSTSDLPTFPSLDVVHSLFVIALHLDGFLLEWKYREVTYESQQEN